VDPTVKKKIAVVTGATSGLGEAAALALARAGFRVLVVGRDAARGEAVVARARAAGGDAEALAADLFTVAGAERLAADVRRLAPALHLLVNNAGAMFSRMELTSDGLERTVALNLLAPFVLTSALVPELAAARGRVVNVVTAVRRRATTTMAQLFAADAAGFAVYARTKLALVALTLEQQRRYGSRGITAVGLHPGVVPGTGFGHEVPAVVRGAMGLVARALRLASTRQQAAARYLALATGEVVPGGLYREGRPAPPPWHAQDAAFAVDLWTRLRWLGRPRAQGGGAAAGRAAGQDTMRG
jgi:NAD(P)-dependent dehydrogenase (short-subunit alcohol dehydrogenase family)